jgi:hypothetical protein
VKNSSDAVAYPLVATPDGLPLGSAEECGRSTACLAEKRRILRQSTVLRMALGLARRRCRNCRDGNGKNRQKLPLSFVSLCSERLTETAAEPYIGPLGCAAASARWRVREAPHCLHGDRASGHARGHVRVTASNARGSGCLTSESEERETWTAESLRAAFRAGESLRANGQEETSAVYVSGQHLVA